MMQWNGQRKQSALYSLCNDVTTGNTSISGVHFGYWSTDHIDTNKLISLFIVEIPILCVSSKILKNEPASHKNFCGESKELCTDSWSKNISFDWQHLDVQVQG